MLRARCGPTGRVGLSMPLQRGQTAQRQNLGEASAAPVARGNGKGWADHACKRCPGSWPARHRNSLPELAVTSVLPTLQTASDATASVFTRRNVDCLTMLFRIKPAESIVVPGRVSHVEPREAP